MGKRADYFKYMGRARLDKAINTLLGILHGMALDSKITQSEVALLSSWVMENQELRNKHPFTELMPVISSCLEDGYLEPDEMLDLIWICEKLRSTEYYDLLTSDIQTLHGILAAIASDKTISLSELQGLSEWLEDHAHLRGCWPYEEVGTLVTSILSDKRVDESESRLFQQFCGEFVPVSSNSSISQPIAIEGLAVKGLCATCPDVQFQNSIFCFTGESRKYPRHQLIEVVQELAGTAIKNVTQELDYLVIGAGSNPCWAYACYGRKVEKAIELRKMGFKLMLIHENDFLDAALGSSKILERWSQR